jgi:hypothetical protein
MAKHKGNNAVGGAVGGATGGPNHPAHFYHYLVHHDLAPAGLAHAYKAENPGAGMGGFNPYQVLAGGDPGGVNYKHGNPFDNAQQYLHQPTTPDGLGGNKLNNFQNWMQAAGTGTPVTPGAPGPGGGGPGPGGGGGTLGDGTPYATGDPGNWLGNSFNYGPGPYIGNGNTVTTLPQPLVDLLAPTSPGVPPSAQKPGGGSPDAPGAKDPGADDPGNDDGGSPGRQRHHQRQLRQHCQNGNKAACRRLHQMRHQNNGTTSPTRTGGGTVAPRQTGSGLPAINQGGGGHKQTGKKKKRK